MSSATNIMPIYDKTANKLEEPKPSIAGKVFRATEPIFRKFNDEHAYKLTRLGLRVYPLWLKRPAAAATNLKTMAFGCQFLSPLGIAAGFDKNGEFTSALLHLRAGFVEIGTATPKPQKPNQGQVIKIINGEKACINALGFPNYGIDALIKKLAKHKRKNLGIIGVNIGPNRDSADLIADYVLCLEKLLRAKTQPDYITINVSSPNTKNLRVLESVDQLAILLDSLPQTNIPILVKVSPDMDDEAYDEIASLALEKNIAGLVATNTTLNHKHSFNGGLSGKPLNERAQHITRLLYKKLQGKLPIISAGGISNGADAYRRIRAGANLVQLYTALIWGGPDLIANINHQLSLYLKQDGFDTITDAVGADYKST